MYKIIHDDILCHFGFIDFMCAYIVYKQGVTEYIAGEKAVFRYTRLADFSRNKLIFKIDKYVWCEL